MITTDSNPSRPRLGRAWIVYMMFNRSVTRPGLANVVVVVAAHGAIVVAQDASIDRQTQPGPGDINRLYSIMIR